MVKFTESDRNILETYKITIKGLSLLFGKQCEFVLHSLENLENSVIAIENGYLSGRKIGSPITDRALKFLERHTEKELDTTVYDTQFTSGKNARSLTIPIKNKTKIIALLCINMNIDLSIEELFQMFSKVENNVSKKNEKEIFSKSIDEMMQNMIDTYYYEVANDNSVAYSEKNKEIILRLKNVGFFNLKGGAESIAQRLSISVHTVYANIRRNSNS